MRLVNSVRQKFGPCRSGRFSSSQFIAEVAKVESLPIERNGRGPLLKTFLPRYAPMLRRSSASTTVLGIPRGRNDAEITSSTVKPITVDVISFATIFGAREPQQFSVQHDRDTLAVPSFTSCGIALAALAPVPLTRPFCVGSINQCVGAERTIAGVQSDSRGQSIRRQNRRLSMPVAIAGWRTKDAFTTLQRGRYDPEGLLACRACSGDSCTLGRHRLSPVGGVTPRAATNSAGALLCPQKRAGGRCTCPAAPIVRVPGARLPGSLTHFWEHRDYTTDQIAGAA